MGIKKVLPNKKYAFELYSEMELMGRRVQMCRYLVKERRDDRTYYVPVSSMLTGWIMGFRNFHVGTTHIDYVDGLGYPVFKHERTHRFALVAHHPHRKPKIVALTDFWLIGEK